jgi:hypothetical protein
MMRIEPVNLRRVLEQYERPGTGDHPLQHSRGIGLRHPSTARLSNLVAIEKTLIKRLLR